MYTIRIKTTEKTVEVDLASKKYALEVNAQLKAQGVQSKVVLTKEVA